MGIRVSIICATYNQEKYISDAIMGFVNQITNFDYEILIHDDCSTDNTVNIVERYQKKYPGMIKLIKEDENKWSKGVQVTDKIMIPMAKGDYIALCEGDDYWIDSRKLQKQFDFMEKNPDCDLCAHAAYKVDASTKRIIGDVRPSKKTTIFNLHKVILGDGGFVATNSLFFRKKVITDNTYDFYKYISFDYTKQILGSIKGGMGYIPDVMSCYRIKSEGSWTEEMILNPLSKIQFNNKVIHALLLLNSDTNYKYDSSINIKILQYEFSNLELNKDFKKMSQKKYKHCLREKGYLYRIKFFIKIHFPTLHMLKKRGHNDK